MTGGSNEYSVIREILASQGLEVQPHPKEQKWGIATRQGDWLGYFNCSTMEFHSIPGSQLETEIERYKKKKIAKQLSWAEL